MLVLGRQAVGRLEALAGDLEALFGVLGDAVRGHLAVEKVDDGEHQPTLVHVTAHLDLGIARWRLSNEDGSLVVVAEWSASEWPWLRVNAFFNRIKRTFSRTQKKKVARDLFTSAKSVHRHFYGKKTNEM